MARRWFASERASDDRLRPVEVAADPRATLAASEGSHLRLGDPHAVAARALLDRHAVVSRPREPRGALRAAHVGEVAHETPALLLAGLVKPGEQLPVTRGEELVLVGALLQRELSHERVVFSDFHALHASERSGGAQSASVPMLPE